MSAQVRPEVEVRGRETTDGLACALARLEEVVSRFEALARRGTHADLPGNGQETE